MRRLLCLQAPLPRPLWDALALKHFNNSLELAERGMHLAGRWDQCLLASPLRQGALCCIVCAHKALVACATCWVTLLA